MSKIKSKKQPFNWSTFFASWLKSLRNSALTLLGICAFVLVVKLSQVSVIDQCQGGLSSVNSHLCRVIGFKIDEIRVEGIKHTSKANLSEFLSTMKGTSIFSVNLDDVRHKIEDLPWVSEATIVRKLPNKLFINLREKEPVILWQHKGQKTLLSLDGSAIPGVDLEAYNHLPFVVGERANEHIPELFDIIRSEPELAQMTTTAVLISNRRWDIKLRDSITVKLPEDNAIEAWKNLAKLIKNEALLERDISIVDLRIPDRLIFRVNNNTLTSSRS